MGSARIPLSQLSSLYRELSDLLNAGMPLPAALRIAAGQASHAGLRRAAERMLAGVRGGQSLSAAMKAAAGAFPDLHAQLVAAGETGGVLDRALERLADSAEREEDTRAQIRAALTYPAFIAAVGTLTIVFMLALIVPRIAAMFSDLQQNLPLPTRALIAVSAAFQRFGWLALLLLAAAAAHFRARARDWAVGGALCLPYIGAWMVHREIAQYARTLGTLLQSGVPIAHALRIAAQTARPGALGGAVAAFECAVRSGERLSGCLRRASLFPASVCNLVATSEEGGRLDAALLKVADAFDRKAQRELKVMVSLVEPLLILAIGSALGLVVVCIMLPIFEIDALIQ